MGHFLAASSGGYQAFSLRGQDWVWLVFAVACAIVAIATGFFMRRQVLKADGDAGDDGDRQGHPGGRRSPTCGASTRRSA